MADQPAAEDVVRQRVMGFTRRTQFFGAAYTCSEPDARPCARRRASITARCRAGARPGQPRSPRTQRHRLLRAPPAGRGRRRVQPGSPQVHRHQRPQPATQRVAPRPHRAGRRSSSKAVDSDAHSRPVGSPLLRGAGEDPRRTRDFLSTSTSCVRRRAPSPDASSGGQRVAPSLKYLLRCPQANSRTDRRYFYP